MKQKREIMIIPETKENIFDDKLDFYKHVVQIHGNLKDNVTSDMVMAKFDDDKVKKYITEMTFNAYHAKGMFDNVITNYNRMKKKYGFRDLTKEEEKKIKERGSIIFDKVMCRLQMLAILNRNHGKNELLKLLISGTPTEEEQEDIETSKMQKELKKRLKNEENKD